MRTCFVCGFETTDLSLMKGAGCDDGCLMCKDAPACALRRVRRDGDVIGGLRYALRLLTFTQEHGEQLIKIISDRMPDKVEKVAHGILS